MINFKVDEKEFERIDTLSVLDKETYLENWYCNCFVSNYQMIEY